MIALPEIDGVTFDSAGGACPFQAEGLVDGSEFYFRYRRGYASFEADGRTAGESYGEELQGSLGASEFAALFTRLIRVWRAEAAQAEQKGGES